MALMDQQETPSGASRFSEIGQWVLIMLAFCLIPDVFAAGDVVRREVSGSHITAAREALVEAIEGEGLVVSAVIPFDTMLARTGPDLGKEAMPFAAASIVQFCSSMLAWQLLAEDVAQIALCPLSISLYEQAARPGRVVMVYRSPGKATPGRRAATRLLQKLVARAADLARVSW